MEQKKKNRCLVVIVLLIILVLSLGGYIVYDKVMIKEDVIDNGDKGKTTKKDSQNIEYLETTSELVVSLLGKLNNLFTCQDFKEVYLTDGIFKGEDFPNDVMFLLALRGMRSEVVGDITTGRDFKDFTNERLEKEIKSLVGDDYSFEHKTYTSCPTWEYDVNTKTYKAPAESACGCTTGPYHTIAKTSKVWKTDKTVEIYQRVIFVDSMTGKGYSDSKKTKEITDFTRLGGMYENAIDENDINNIAKGTLYKLVFSEKNDNYIFTSAAPVNE